MNNNYTIYNFYNEIVETNRIVGNDFNDNKLIKPYIKFTTAEFFEIFEKGFDKNDNIEILDGIIDSLVTGYFLYCIKRNNTTIKTYQTKKMTPKEIGAKLNELKQTILNDKLFDNIEYFIQEIFNIGSSTEFDILGAAKEVNASNLTKFPPIDSVDPDKELEKLNKGKYKNCYYKIRKNIENEDVYVFYSGEGKYIKPSSFVEPNLKPYIPQGYDFISMVKPFI